MINLKSQTISYNETPILVDIDLTIENNALYLITGESGAGKTTLLNLLALELDGAQYEFNQTMISSLSAQEKKNFCAQHISYVKQNCPLLSSLSVKDNLELIDQIFHQKVDRHRIQDICEKLNIKSIWQRKVERLSGGERQRVAIACALLREVDLYLFDEPTSMQDLQNKQRVVECIESLQERGKMVVVVTHEPHLFARQSAVFHIDAKQINCSSQEITKAPDRPINEVKPLNQKKAQKALSVHFYKAQLPIHLTIVFVISICLMTLLYHLTSARGLLKTYDSKITSLYEKELYVVTTNVSSNIYDDPFSDPLSTEMINQIRALEHVTTVEQMLSLTLQTPTYDKTGAFIGQYLDSHDYNFIEVLRDGQVISSYSPLQTLAILPAYTHQEYDKRSELDPTVTEGIYISKALASELGITTLNGESLTLHFSVPVAGEKTIREGYVGFNEEEVIQRGAVNLFTQETFPIRGIIQDDVFNTYLGIQYMNDIYLPIEEIQAIYEKYHEQFLALIDKGDNDISQLELIYPNWEASSFIVTMDDAKYQDSISQQIQQLNSQLVIHKPNFNEGGYVVDSVNAMFQKSVILYVVIMITVIIVGLSILYTLQDLLRKRNKTYLDSLNLQYHRSLLESSIDLILVCILSQVFVYLKFSTSTNEIVVYPYDQTTVIITFGLCLITILLASFISYLLLSQMKIELNGKMRWFKGSETV